MAVVTLQNEATTDSRSVAMKRMRLLVPLGAALTAVAVLGYFWFFHGNGKELRLHGTVEVQEVRLSSKIGGRVKAIRVREGDLVKPGQRIVELEAPELEAVRLQLVAQIDAATAQFDKTMAGARPEERRVAKAAMQSAEARYQKMKNGYRSEEIEQSRSDLAAAQADRELAQENFRRASKLFPAGISRQEYDTASTAVNRADEQVKAARAKLQLLEAGYRQEEIAEAKAEWERAKSNWELVEAGSRSEDIADAEAKVAELKAKLQETLAQLREAVVVAPEHAVVEVLAVRPGDVLTPNQPVARVLRAEDLWVKAFVPEIELGKVRLHQQVVVTCDAYPGKRFEGEVVYIASTSEFTPRNVQSYDERRHQVFAIKVRVKDPQGVFKSGMAAEVVLPLE
jgi:multidrug resistance efflux pump